MPLAPDEGPNGRSRMIARAARAGRRLTALALAVLALLALAGAPTARAQEAAAQDAGTGRIPGLVDALENQAEVSFLPTPVDPALLDEAGRAAQRRAFQAYFDYRADGFEHRRRVFEWQLWSSKVIFGLVVSLVSVGIFFSWLQFRQGLRPGPERVAPGETTFEATAQGLKVTSPVLGVVILTISLAFFYLYLVYVYPIEEIL